MSICKVLDKVTQGETLCLNGWITTESTTCGTIVYLQWRIRPYWKPAKFYPSPWDELPF